MQSLRKSIFMIMDISIALVSISISYILYFMDKGLKTNIVSNINELIYIAIIFCFTNIFMNYFFGIYKSIWKYAGLYEVIQICKAVFLTSMILGFVVFISSAHMPRLVYLSTAILLFVFTGASRISYRVFKKIIRIYGNNDEKIRLLVVGAGITGSTIITNIQKTMDSKYVITGLVDDDPLKNNALINGTRVLGNSSKIPELVKQFHINEVLIAIPSIKRRSMTQILGICNSIGVKVKIMPRLDEFDYGNDSSIHDARNIKIEDLLGREEVNLDNDQISSYITDKIVLVSGGGGSIGSELCRQIARFKPKRIVVFDIYENNVYELQQNFKRIYSDIELIIAMGTVRDKDRLFKVFKAHRPDVVFHAAAHKHVPLMENDPGEAVKNNIFGTLNMLEVSDSCNVKRFILISSDKAVNPTNVMGATKRICEILLQSFSLKSKTIYSAVRFGNVLGSNGSVIPLFLKQIEEGGPVTVTNESVTRYFMSIPEAAKLVIQAGAFANGGEIYVLDMGEPIRISDLAKDLIRLMGYEPEKDIKIEYIGLRPGEKLYEELMLPEEGLFSTKHKSILICKALKIDMENINAGLKKLQECDNEGDYIYYMHKLLPSFISPESYDEAAATAEI